MHNLFTHYIMTLTDCSCIRYIIDRLFLNSEDNQQHTCAICLDNTDKSQIESVDYYMTHRKCKCNYYMHKKCFYRWCSYNENYTENTKCIMCNTKCKKKKSTFTHITCIQDCSNEDTSIIFEALFFLLYFRRYGV